jgi:hypothetical protein
VALARSNLSLTRALASFLCRVEEILNHWSLTRVSDDVHEVLTSSHLLAPRGASPTTHGCLYRQMLKCVKNRDKSNILLNVFYVVDSENICGSTESQQEALRTP